MNANLLYINYNNKNKTLYCTWQNNTLTAEWPEMESTMLNYIRQVEEFEPANIIVDERLLKYPWLPENQKWVDEFIVPKLKKLNINKFAIIQSNDILQALAVELMMEEPNARTINTQFFKSLSDAENWIVNETDN